MEAGLDGEFGGWNLMDEVTMAGVDKLVDQAQAILKEKSIDGYEIYFNQSIHFDVESKEG